MPLNKEAYIRYKIIDACIANNQKPFPSMEEIIEVCENKLGKSFTVSTIQKDIKALKEDEALGFYAPIKFSKRHNGYYYSDKDFSINKLPLQNNEIEALKNANEILQAFGGKQLNDAYHQAYIKLMSSLNEKIDTSRKSIPLIYAEQPPLHSGFHHFSDIFEAIKSKRVIQFDHISYHSAELTTPVLHPYQLMEFNHYWYVIGYSQERKDIRVFGLDRIRSEIVYPDMKFNNTRFNDVKKYNENMYGVFPLAKAKLREIKFACTPFLSLFLETHPMHQSQKKLRKRGGGLTYFSVNLITTLELVRWFFSNYTELRVLDKRIENEIQKMLSVANEESIFLF